MPAPSIVSMRLNKPWMAAGLLGTAQCQGTGHEGQDYTAESGYGRGTGQPPYLQLCSSPQHKHGVYLLTLPHLA